MNSLVHAVSSDIHRTNWRRVAKVAAAAVVFLILAAVITPGIGSLPVPAKEPIYRHKARCVVYVYLEGAEAGIIWNGKTREDRIEAVCKGQKTPDDSAAPGKLFGVPFIGAEMTDVSKYIGMNANGDLFYDKSGGQSGS